MIPAEDRLHYTFRSPVASSIYPNLTNPDETLSLLHEINASRPLSKRLPIELLLHINKELHRPNPLWEDIRAAWKPMAEKYLIDWRHYTNLLEFGEEALFYQARVDRKTKRFYIPENISTGNSAVDVRKFRRPPIQYLTQMTSADLLYRSLCYFPEIYIDTGHGGQLVWSVKIQHKQTGLIFSVGDWKRGDPQLSAFYNNDIVHSGLSETESRITLLKEFSMDLLRLLNAFFGTIDGSRRLEYYHPAADADSPTRDEHYVVVPTEWSIDRIEGMEDYWTIRWIFDKWHFTKVSTTDLSSFRSLLQTLKYDIQSRRIDPVNGTANLTTVISSALLFYRLICKYSYESENVNLTPPITSVWQIQLTHRKTGASIIFMDDHGLFDIRGSENTKEVMSDVEALVESLCRDSCTHPDDRVVGCIIA